jgi:NAD(P)-dependent dehydrogenase (short-subunit alcohol dehydrogenase family)
VLFEGKVVFIAGGAVRFGRAFTKAFCAEGATTVIADIDNHSAEETASSLRDSGVKAKAAHSDVASLTTRVAKTREGRRAKQQHRAYTSSL